MQSSLSGNLSASDTKASAQNLIATEAEASLEDPNSTSYGYDGVSELHRDILMGISNDHVMIAYLGLENQSAIDKDMPFRILSYDDTHYALLRRRAQSLVKSYKAAAGKALLSSDIAVVSDKVSKNESSCKDGTGTPVRLSKSVSGILPVVTMVLYFGNTQWKKPRCLKDCLNFKNKSEFFNELMSDYKINVYQIALPSSTIQFFKSDFAVIADYIQQKRRYKNYDGRRNDELGLNRKLTHPQETLALLYCISKDNRFKKVI